jgi:hypothetical protein
MAPAVRAECENTSFMPFDKSYRGGSLIRRLQISQQLTAQLGSSSVSGSCGSWGELVFSPSIPEPPIKAGSRRS